MYRPEQKFSLSELLKTDFLSLGIPVNVHRRMYAAASPTLLSLHPFSMICAPGLYAFGKCNST